MLTTPFIAASTLPTSLNEQNFSEAPLPNIKILNSEDIHIIDGNPPFPKNTPTSPPPLAPQTNPSLSLKITYLNGSYEIQGFQNTELIGTYRVNTKLADEMFANCSLLTLFFDNKTLSQLKSEQKQPMEDIPGSVSVSIKDQETFISNTLANPVPTSNFNPQPMNMYPATLNSTVMDRLEEISSTLANQTSLPAPLPALESNFNAQPMSMYPATLNSTVMERLEEISSTLANQSNPTNFIPNVATSNFKPQPMDMYPGSLNTTVMDRLEEISSTLANQSTSFIPNQNPPRPSYQPTIWYYPPEIHHESTNSTGMFPEKLNATVSDRLEEISSTLANQSNPTSFIPNQSQGLSPSNDVELINRVSEENNFSNPPKETNTATDIPKGPEMESIVAGYMPIRPSYQSTVWYYPPERKTTTSVAPNPQ